MGNKPILTIVMPCYERYKETIRAIDSIKNQDIDGWEAIVMGDCCDAFQELIDTGYLDKVKEEVESRGNSFRYFNAKERCGSYGWQLMNYGFKKARGKYLVFLNNDDCILPTHFRHYLSEIHDTNLDLVYYNSQIFANYEPVYGWCDIDSYSRNTKLECGFIGHCDIILKTQTIKKLNYQHKPKMGEDWDLIHCIASNNGKVEKSKSKCTTYMVKPPINHKIDIEFDVPYTNVVTRNIKETYKLKKIKKTESENIKLARPCGCGEKEAPNLEQKMELPDNLKPKKKQKKQIVDEMPKINEGDKEVSFIYDSELGKYIVLERN